MTSRFVSNLTTLLAGAFLACFALTLSTSTVSWLTLAIGCAVALVVLCAFALRGRGVAQRVFDGCILLAAFWSIVASRAFSGVELKWISFADAAAMVLLAFAGLVVHEVLMELAIASRRDQPMDGLLVDERARATLGAVR